MQDKTAIMTTTLSTTMGLVFRKGEVIQVTSRQTNSGLQYGTLIKMGYDTVFVPIDCKCFKWEED